VEPIGYVNIDVAMLHAHDSGLTIRRADSKLRVTSSRRLARLTGARQRGVCHVSVSDAIYHLGSRGRCGCCWSSIGGC